MSVKSKQKNNSKQFHMEKKRNLWVIPTDNPSRLFYNVGGALLFTKWDNYNGVNIYITSDEYIGLSYYLDGNLVRKGVIDDKEYWEVRKDYKKIILTTDQDLIKDGVQAIDDEFLEWFVKNSSCESVEVLEAPKLIKMIDNEFYKIIIPKEEPKQETLEEIANKIYHNTKHSYPVIPNYTNWIQGFVEGTKYQQERMYSEEEVLDILIKLNDSPFEFDFDSEVEEWFEQFKKK